MDMPESSMRVQHYVDLFNPRCGADWFQATEIGSTQRWQCHDLVEFVSHEPSMHIIGVETDFRTALNTSTMSFRWCNGDNDINHIIHIR